MDSILHHVILNVCDRSTTFRIALLLRTTVVYCMYWSRHAPVATVTTGSAMKGEPTLNLRNLWRTYFHRFVLARTHYGRIKNETPTAVWL